MLAGSFSNLASSFEMPVLFLGLWSTANESSPIKAIDKNKKKWLGKRIKFLMVKKYTEAIEQFRKVIKIDSANKPAHLELLAIFKLQNNNYESQIIVKDMLKKFGDSPMLHTELCRIYTEDAYVEQAIESCKEAIRHSPKDPENYANLAQSHMDREELNEGEQILKKASQKFKNSERIFFMIGDHYYKEKNYLVANRYFNQAMKADPKSFRSALGLANSSFAIGKLEEALVGFKNACNTNSKDTLKDFKNAVTKLRLEKNYVWEQKYNSVLFSCMR